MSVLPNLEKMLGDAAERLAPDRNDQDDLVGSRRVAGWWRRGAGRWRPLALIVVLALGGATGALAAAGVFQTGTPVGPPAGYAPVANVGFGAPLPGGITVLPLRAADPAGGPPWGIGVFRTTQGLACLVTARVVDGRLGVLGIDYAFTDDGRFHPILASAAITPSCTPPDARGHLFITGGGLVINASAYYAPACLTPGSLGGLLRCPESDLRSVFSGFLGPDARSVSYTSDGVRHLEHTFGPNGAFLVVLPAPPGANVGRAERTGHIAAGVTVYVTYVNGRRCTVASADPNAGGPNACTDVGYVEGPLDLPTRAALATNADVSYQPALSVALLAPGPALVVKFIARLAITTSRNDYAVQVSRPNTHACAKATAASDGAITLQDQTQRNVAAGQTVGLVVALQPACAGRYTGRVYFNRGLRYDVPFLPRLNLPGRDHPATVTVATFAINVP
jgi:hypothetical protein